MRLESLKKVLIGYKLKDTDRYLEKITRHILRPLKSFSFNLLNKSFSKKEAIIIFSEARGGSTWLGEVLSKALNAILIFEPLWGKHGKFKKIAHFYSSPFYLGNSDSEHKLINFLNDTFKGKQASARTLQFNSFKKLLNSKRLIIKLVNVNLITPWFVNHFSFKHKPIYLIRHPLAILSSRLKYGYDKNIDEKSVGPIDLNRLKCSSHPHYEHLVYLNNLNTDLERYVAEWCIRNQRVIGSGNINKKLTILFYEDLISEAENYYHVFEKLGISRQDYLKYLNINSKTTTVGENVNNKKAQLSKWEKSFTMEQKERFQKIFDHFNLKIYSAFEARPNKDIKHSINNYNLS